MVQQMKGVAGKCFSICSFCLLFKLLQITDPLYIVEIIIIIKLNSFLVIILFHAFFLHCSTELQLKC